MYSIINAGLEMFRDPLTPTIAGIAVYVAWQQWRTARAKLRLDLFDKRYAAYRRVQAAIDALSSGINRDSVIGGERVQSLFSDFWRAKNEVRLMFGNDVDLVLGKLGEEFHGMTSLTLNLQMESSPANQAPIASKIIDHRKKILEIKDELLCTCEKYIRVKKVFG